MKKLFTSIILLTLLCSKSFAAAINAPSTINIPAGGSTLKKILDTLNAHPLNILGVGPVTINLPPGWHEVAPPGGWVLGSDSLNPSVTTNNQIIINCGNARLVSNTGTGGHDAIFTIKGTDFATINGGRFSDSSANTTSTSMMEHGISIVKLNSSDACKTVTVRGSDITLNKTNTTAASGVSHLGAAGIFVGNCTSTSTAALASPPFAVYEGGHEGILLDGNTIQNVTNGVFAYGLPTIVDGIAVNDQNLYVWNNTISNFTHLGVYSRNVQNTDVSTNKIDNLASGGTAPTGNNIFGVVMDEDKVTAYNRSWICQKNNIKLNSASTVGNLAIGIYTNIYGSGTTDINNDTLELTASGNVTTLEGIRSENNQGTQLIQNNLMQNFTTAPAITTSGNILGIRNGQTVSPYGYPSTTLIKNNVIKGFNVANTGGVYGIVDQSSTSVGPNIEGNLIDNFTLNANALVFRGITNGQAVAVANTSTIKDNTISNIKATGTTTLGQAIRTAASNLVSCIVTGNKVRNLYFGSGTVMAAEIAYGVKATLDKDTFDNINSTGGSVYGIQAGYFNNIAVTTLEFTKCQISNLLTDATNASAQAIAIAPGVSFLTTAANIANNKIFNIYGSGSGDTAAAIATRGGTASYTITNNMISDVESWTNTTVYSSSFGIWLQSTGTHALIYNTINMKTAPAGAKDYGSTGIQFVPSGTNTVQNNIVRVNVLAGTGNNVSAIRAFSGSALAAPSTTGFGAASNIYHTPTGSNNYLYVEGTSNTSLVNGYHISGLTPNNTKNIVNDTFFNSSCNKSSYHKFMQSGSATREKNTATEDNLSGSGGSYTPSGITFAESTAFDGPVGVDLILTPRPFGASDIGALEFNGTTLPVMAITIVSSTGLDTACTYNLPKLTGSIPSFFNRSSFQWYRDTTKIPGATTSSIFVTPVSGNYILKVYDSVTGCTYASSPYRMTIMPPPPAIITYYDSLTFCESSAIVIQANKGYSYSYRWFRNSILMPGETDDHLVVDKSGDYTLEVNTPLGCPTKSTAIRVKVYPLPTPTVYYSSPRVLETQKYFTYQWYKNNVKINDSDALGKRYYVLDDGAYSVEVTDSNGCTSKSDVYLYSLGIDENKIVADIKIFPNPASDILHIQSPISLNARLTDMSGRTILNKINVSDLDITTLANGLYLLNLSDKEGKLILVEKINKEK